MLAVSKALHSVLVQAPDLPVALLACAEGLKNRIGSPDNAPKAFEVAQVLEHCDPDRSRALAAYVIAWKSDPGRLDALSRARHLGRELGDFVTSAKLAHLQHRHAPDPTLLVFEGNAWLDAGDPDRAIKPLLAAVRKLPGDERVTLALATAQREWPDVRAQIESLRQTAATQRDNAEAAELLLQAARMLNMLQTNDREVEACLLDAFDRDPENLSALGLLEGRLDTLVGEDRFMQICERRIGARTTPAGTAEELRRAGTRMTSSPRFQGLGIRLLERCLNYAYEEKLESIPGHVATLSLLSQHARVSKLHSEFLELIDRGLSVALSEIDHGVMATQALDISWRHSIDDQAARTYAAIASALAPRHPLVLEAREAGLDAPAAVEADLDLQLLDDSIAGVPDPVVGFDDSGPGAGPIEIPAVETDDGEFLSDDDLELVADDAPTLIAETILVPEGGSVRHLKTAPMPVVDFPPAQVAEPVALARLALKQRAVSARELKNTVDMPFGGSGSRGGGGPSLIPSSAINALRTATSARKAAQVGPAERPYRLVMPMSCELLAASGRTPGSIRDISVSGIFLLIPTGLAVGQTLDLEISLPRDKGMMQTDKYLTRVRVARHVPRTGYGAAFVAPASALVRRIQTLIDEQNA